MPLCERCGSERASSFSWFEEERDWQFTGDCTIETESYYVLLREALRSKNEWSAWMLHLSRKEWFDSFAFAAMLDRFMAAGGVLPRGATFLRWRR